MPENQEISAEEAKLVAAAQIQDTVITKNDSDSIEQTRQLKN